MSNLIFLQLSEDPLATLLAFQTIMTVRRICIMHLPDLEHKKFILEQIAGNIQTDGPIPSIPDLNFFLSKMDPNELAQAIYLLQYQECKKSFSSSSLIGEEALRDRVFFSQEIKSEIEKIFMAVAEHFKRVPGEASAVVDQMFRYFYKTLVHLATQKGWSSLN